MPERLGRYILDKKIGAGGMADVFLAHGPHGACVVKRPHPQLSANADFVRMFLDEASLLAQLHHPGIAQIFDLGHIGGVYYLAMEYVPGFDLMTISLEHERNGELIAPELCARIVADAAEALHYAHEARGRNGQPLNIIHRDVTPHNVLLSTEGVVKLIDFGVARASTATHRTQAGLVKGKYPYMSPEQITGQEIDRRVDVYALGLVLYELLTNVRAIAGDTEVQQIDNARAARIRPIEQLRPNVPFMLRQIIAGCLQPQVANRYPTALVVREQLEAYLKAERHVVGREDLLRLFRVVAAEVAQLDTLQEGDEPARPTEPLQAAVNVQENPTLEDPDVGFARTRETSKVRPDAREADPQADVTTDQDMPAVRRPPIRLDQVVVPSGPPGEPPSNPAPIQPRPPTPGLLGPPPGSRPSGPAAPPASRPSGPAAPPAPRPSTPGSKASSSGPLPRPPGPSGPRPGAGPAQPPPSAPRSAALPQPAPDLLETLPPDAPLFHTGPAQPPVPAELPPPAPRGRALGVVLALFVVAGASALSVWWLAGRGGVEAAADAGVALAFVPQPLPLFDAGAEAEAADAAAGEEVAPGAGAELAAAAPDASAADARAAILEVSCEPPAQISVDGQGYGKTPQALELAAGQHTVRLFNRELDFTVYRKVSLKPGDKKPLDVKLAKGTVEVRVNPFGEIRLDGKVIAQSSFKVLEVWEGTHTVEVTLAEKGAKKKKTVTLKGGEVEKVEFDFLKD